MNLSDLTGYALRRLIFVLIVWAVATYVAPHLLF